MARVLVTDDEIIVCKNIGKILNRQGHTVDYTLTASEALDRLEKGEEYDTVITDLMMPKISGMDLLEKVRKEWPDVPVIMITGYATVKTAIQAMKLGAFDYIPKPFTPEELRAVVDRALERKRLAKEQKKAEGIAVSEKQRATKDYYFIPEHAWAKKEDDSVLIGVDQVFLKTIGEIINVDLPIEGDALEQGKACVRLINSSRKIYSVWSPLSGGVIDLNHDLNKDCSPLNTDLYGKGWMVRIKPLNLEEEVKNLLFRE